MLLGLFGLWAFAHQRRLLGLLTLLLAFFLYQAAGAAVVQGALGRRIQNITVADIMDREPVTIPADADAARRPGAVLPALPLAVVRGRRSRRATSSAWCASSASRREIAAGRPALPVVDVLEEDLPVRIGEEAPLESLLGAEGLGRLGAMVAVDERRRAAGRGHARAGAPGAAPGAPARPAT